MKRDLDAILQANDIDAMLITGPAQHNPAMVYMTGGGHLTNADLIKKRGEPPILFHASMERDEAAKTGLATRGYNLYPYKQLMEEAGGDRVKAIALRYVKMLTEAGVRQGRVALFGNVELSTILPVWMELQKLLPEVQWVGDLEGKLILAAALTKDDAEIDHIRAMGRVTVETVSRTAEFLSSQAVENDTLVNPDGKPVTIGQVKGLINRWLAELGAENPEGTIFAIGRDAGVPHSSGNPADVMRLGQTIVYDIFPCQAGGGYYYDFTRTWSLGYATDEAQQLYDQVLSVYRQIRQEMTLGEHFGVYQKRACELFEAMGHPTVLSTPETEAGYVHSLGHGLGLRVHERPFSGAGAPPEDKLVVGSVVTVEPGLYYPERGLGVRIEDSVWVRPDGVIETFVDYPYELVLPVRHK